MQTEVLTSKKRIKGILASEVVEGVGIFDRDIELYPSATAHKDSEKFFLFSFNGPFQRMGMRFGLEDALVRFAQEPRQALLFSKDCLKEVMSDYKALQDTGYKFDGAWMGEDIAYDKGLYFSVNRYENQLFAIHREFCSFFKSAGLDLFFHCDGNCETLVPFLAQMKASAVHPMQESCNQHLLELKDDFRGVLTFVGGVGLHRLREDRHALAQRVNLLRAGGSYIFSFDGPVPSDVNNKEYESILDFIQTTGACR